MSWAVFLRSACAHVMDALRRRLATVDEAGSAASSRECRDLSRCIVALARVAALPRRARTLLASCVTLFAALARAERESDQDERLLADIAVQLDDYDTLNEHAQARLCHHIGAVARRGQRRDERVRRQWAQAYRIRNVGRAFQRSVIRVRRPARRSRVRRTVRRAARRVQVDAGGSDGDAPSPSTGYPAEVLELTSEEAHLRTAPPPEDLCWAALRKLARSGAHAVEGALS